MFLVISPREGRLLLSCQLIEGFDRLLVDTKIHEVLFEAVVRDLECVKVLDGFFDLARMGVGAGGVVQDAAVGGRQLRKRFTHYSVISTR